MTVILLKIGKWLLSKVAAYLLIAVIVVGLVALYLYLSDSIRIERERMIRLEELQVEAQDLYSRLQDLHGQLVETGREMQQARERVAAANRAVEALQGLMSKVEYIFLPAEEKRRRDQELREAQERRDAQRMLLKRLSGEQAALRATRAQLAGRVGEVESSITELQSKSSQIIQYIDASWQRSRPYLLIALAAIVVAPFAAKLCFYYLLAPCLAAVKPIQFESEDLPQPKVERSQVSLHLALQPGETAWVKESYLQASDEGMERRTRFLLDWRIPFSCLASGLVEMVQFRASEEAESSGRITISTQDKPNMELCLVELPEGGRLILRPRHVAGMVSGDGQPSQIRRRWSFRHAQSWITLQFRFFEFAGPCRIVVSGVRGIRAEVMAGRGGIGRRTNQDATIGFASNLSYGATRAETFWSYLRGYNPLFDDVFKGQGVFLCQEISTGPEAGQGRRFWSGIFEGILKVFGI